MVNGRWECRASSVFLPGVDVETDLFAKKIDLVLQVFQLQACFVVSAGARFKLGNLPFNDF